MVATRSGAIYASPLDREEQNRQRKQKNAAHNHLTTPKKNQLLGAVKAYQKIGVWNRQVNLKSIFQELGILKTSGYRVLRQYRPEAMPQSIPNVRRQNPTVNDSRGRPIAIQPYQVSAMEYTIKTGDVQDRAMSWQTLAIEHGLDVSLDTIRRTMGQARYSKCVACTKRYLNPKTKQNRVEFARRMLAKYPTPDHQKRVRFSDEVHFGLGPQGKLMILRKLGQRYYRNCVVERRQPADKDKKKIHTQAAVGWGFKSDLVFYEVTTNNNGKMSHTAYRDQILEPVVKPWILNHHDFVLEEDNDSGYGGGQNRYSRDKNPVSRWKEENHLEYYFNYHSSPDLAIIENCWLPTKSFISRWPHQDEFETRDLALEGWNNQVTQSWINSLVLTMPARLQAVIDMDGSITGYQLYY